MATESPSKPAWVPNPAFPEQNEDGVDLSLIRNNLRLTPLERIRKANRLQRDMIRIRAIARRIIPSQRT